MFKTLKMIIKIPFLLTGVPFGFAFAGIIMGFMFGMELAGFHINEIIDDKFGIKFM